MKTGGDEMINETKWCWAHSDSDEQWQGPHSSRDDAIGEGVHESSKEVGETICVAQCSYPDPAEYVDFIDLIEMVEESAVDNACYTGGDALFDVADVKLAREELDEWARKHLKAQSFTVHMKTIEVVTVTEEMIG